ncbi:hypothetical protein M0804_001723 [Polistes exclamans]|nr:hypothetical protein M0804_001723 [Polistes exclamans]
MLYNTYTGEVFHNWHRRTLTVCRVGVAEFAASLGCPDMGLLMLDLLVLRKDRKKRENKTYGTHGGYSLLLLRQQQSGCHEEGREGRYVYKSKTTKRGKREKARSLPSRGCLLGNLRALLMSPTIGKSAYVKLAIEAEIFVSLAKPD